MPLAEDGPVAPKFKKPKLDLGDMAPFPACLCPCFVGFLGPHATDNHFLDVGRTTYYDATVIRSFRSKDAELIFRGLSSKQFNRLAAVIERKLVQIHAARALADISIFPGNRLEALQGSRLGQHSIRINDQYRLCFIWKDGDAYEVEIVDYH